MVKRHLAADGARPHPEAAPLADDADAAIAEIDGVREGMRWRSRPPRLLAGGLRARDRGRVHARCQRGAGIVSNTLPMWRLRSHQIDGMRVAEALLVDGAALWAPQGGGVLSSLEDPSRPPSDFGNEMGCALGELALPPPRFEIFKPG